MHLHNAHTPSESDGFPGDFYGPHPNQQGPTLSAPGEYWITSTPTTWQL